LGVKKDISLSNKKFLKKTLDKK